MTTFSITSASGRPRDWRCSGERSTASTHHLRVVHLLRGLPGTAPVAIEAAPVIYGKVGRLGHGKTMRAVVDAIALAELRGGLEVPSRCWLASNVRIKAPPGMPFVHLPMEGFSEALSQLMAATRDRKVGVVVLVDEVDEVWGSGDWQSVLKSDRHRIKQSRHYGADLILTAQYIDQIEKSLRNIMEEAELVRAFPAPTTLRREKGKRPLLIRGHRFRPASVRELGHEPDKDKRLGSAWHLYRRKHELLYDTDEIIEPVNAETLCAKHRREAVEDRCPQCHPGRAPGVALLGLPELVVAAADDPSGGAGGAIGAPAPSVPRLSAWLGRGRT